MAENRKSVTPTTLDRGAVLKDVALVVAQQMAVAEETVTEQATLLEDLGCDSLDLVEISMELEEQFDISIPDDFSDQARTIGDVTDGILALLVQSAGAES